ncbi:tRNA pseudouridine(55) synthase TruB [Brevibacillus humidisoli]|uniref:tRNA pseudouridine(55) synthase TruB n=1 Tax=Brevibacillus humidisoli TaxID=2895522 RepID=UPI001E4C92B0|nr:tRNA pseudouridine(55) synthase TruB [Brevibacillus humidisoli]UFJ42172.1 tRNA pseudouridine(55) synthase TruB [Brevibacillus humidisoli]
MSKVHGVLVLNKPAGLTSHDCVARVRRLLQTRKVGHAGTLDPEVTGVLPICLGHATRIIEYLQDLPKAYEVVMRLGTSTTTEDATGEVVEAKSVDAAAITEERVHAAFRDLLGEISQIPPMYSAIKVNGKRLYELARKGEVIERQARSVFIHELRLHTISYSPHVEVRFYCRCSKGTYIRTLCVDLGAALGYPAHMTQLTRVESGSFRLEQTISLEQLEERHHLGQDLSRYLVPIEDALVFLPRVEVSPERKTAVLNGLSTALPGIQVKEGSLIRLFSEDQLLGVHRVCYGPKGPFAKPEKVFHF